MLCKAADIDKLLFSFELLNSQEKPALTADDCFDLIFSSAAAITALLQESSADRSKPTESLERTIELNREALWHRAETLFIRATLDLDNPVLSEDLESWTNNP